MTDNFLSIKVLYFSACKILMPSFLVAFFLLNVAVVPAQSRVAVPNSEFGLPENIRLSSRAARYSSPDSVEAAGFADLNKSQKLSPSADSDIDASFNANVSEGVGYIEDMIVQPDGKIVVGGLFFGVNGEPRRSLARINADGTFDPAFNGGGSGPNANILALVQHPDGRILIGGNGSSYNNVIRGSMTRLFPDGTLDPNFNFGGSGSNGIVEAIAVQPDGKILIGGSFTSYNNIARNRIARLNLDGTLDTSFNPGSSFNGSIFTIAAQPDGKILVGGTFTQFNGSAARAIVRLNADGTLDASFNIGAGPDRVVEKIVLQPDGKILVGGQFGSFNNVEATGIVRLNPNGSIDKALTVPGINFGGVSEVALQTDGKFLVAAFDIGTPDQNSSRMFKLVRFNSDGSLDSTFGAGATDSTIFSIVPHGDGKILIGGIFTKYNNVERRRIARVNADGTLDGNFAAVINSLGLISRIASQADGKIIIGGDFQLVNGVPRNRIARLNADGTLDASFNVGSGSDASITALALQTDGKILIGGSFFTRYNGSAVQNVARLNVDGTLDSSFVFSPFAQTITDIKLQTDGKILVGGFFLIPPAGTSIVRLNSDGNIDTSFSVGSVAGTSRAIEVQSDGKILLGGILAVPQSTNQFLLALIVRLNKDGTIDSTFANNLISSTVEDIAILPDGKIIVVGSFFDANNQFRGILRLLPNGSTDSSFVPSGINGTVRSVLVQPDGKILIGGLFTTRLARINPDGSRDASFNASADQIVNEVALQPDGKILAGGAFTIFNGQPRLGLVRLQGSALLATRTTLYDYDGDRRADVSVFRPSNGVWYLNNSQSGFSAVSFGIGSDKLVPADYDGDGRSDVAVYRDGVWYQMHTTGGFTAISFGTAEDVPQPGDYDGDGKADVAVFRPSSGTWFLLQSQNGFAAVRFGTNGDKPVAADYDGDGKTDTAVYRGGTWYLLGSRNGFSAVQFGLPTDKPVPSDYDGDGKTDTAVYRDGVWYQLRSMQGFVAAQFGLATDTPAPADFDGDGKADLAVFRNGIWYLQQSTSGFSAVQFGINSDIPTPSARVP